MRSLIFGYAQKFSPRFDRFQSFLDLICFNYRQSKPNGVTYAVSMFYKPNTQILYRLLCFNTYCQSFEPPLFQAFQVPSRCFETICTRNHRSDVLHLHSSNKKTTGYSLFELNFDHHPCDSFASLQSLRPFITSFMCHYGSKTLLGRGGNIKMYKKAEIFNTSVLRDPR